MTGERCSHFRPSPRKGSPIFNRFYISKVLCSEGSILFRTLVLCTVDSVKKKKGFVTYYLSSKSVVDVMVLVRGFARLSGSK